MSEISTRKKPDQIVTDIKRKEINLTMSHLINFI